MIFMKKFLRWFWRPRTIFIIGFPLATIFTLLALIVVIVNVRGRHAWEAYAAEARARGVKLSLHELLPPPVPDAENFAAVPLFANVFSDDQAAREKAGKALALPSDDKGKPAISSIGDAHLIDLTEWQAAFVQSKDLPAVGGDPASDVLQAIEHRCGPALIELAEAERRPRSKFPVRWELGIGALLPHLQVCRAAAKIHQVRMAAHLARHENAAAYAEFHGALSDYRALDQEPTLISVLVRFANINAAISGVWDGLVRGLWEDADLVKIEADLAPLNLLADYRFGLNGERAWLNDTCGKMIGADPQTAEMLRAFRKSGGLEATAANFARVPGFIYFNQVALNRYNDGRCARVDPVAMRLRPLPADAFDVETFRQKASFLKRPFYALLFLTAPALENIERNCLYSQTLLHCTRLACALERARRADGTYPETLDALMPKHLAAIPHDIIDGQPPRYRRTEDGHFILYSVAMNARDDGGTGSKTENARDADDWVWRWPDADAQPRK